MRDRLDIIHSNMVQRCTNPLSTYYYRYGGRGIKMCDEWRHDRKAFKKWAMQNGYREDLTIDRIDNDGDYTPENCRWVTMKENINNSSRCHYVTAFGEKHSLKVWSELLGISYNTLKKRVIDNHEDGEYLLRPSRRKVGNV